jgi:hypothetical protein
MALVSRKDDVRMSMRLCVRVTRAAMVRMGGEADGREDRRGWWQVRSHLLDLDLPSGPPNTVEE